MASPKTSELGRSAASVAEAVRQSVLEGKFESGKFLPPIRELTRTLPANYNTVRRALKALEAEGLVAAEPRHGYRVLPRANDPERGCPLAYVYWSQENPELGSNRGDVAMLRHAAIQRVAARRGWTLLVASTDSCSREELVEQLRASRACGVALDTHNPELLEFFRSSGLPVIQVNTWVKDSDTDSINHDGQQGGLLAARYLAERGHHRIGWFGLLVDTVHSIDRYGGSLVGLRNAGLDFAPELLVDTSDRSTIKEKARALLSRPDRPEAIIALWASRATALAEAAAELGLVVGRDFEMVGWAAEELYDSVYRPAFREGEVPPTVTWSAAQLAEAAVDRLVARRAAPDMPTMRIKIPVKLRLGDNG